MPGTNIVHLRSSEFFGGPERAIIGQCTNVKGYNYTVVSFIRKNAENKFLQEARKAGLQTAEIHDAFAGDFRVIGQLKKLLKNLNANILVCHDYKSNFFVRFAIRGTGVRQIAHFRGYTWEDKKVKFYNSINALMLRRMPLVLAVSEKSSKILQSMGVSQSKIEVIPNAIEDFKLIGDDFQRKVVSSKTIVGICAGRLSSEKGQDILIRAAAFIKDRFPDFRIDIYGHGPEEKKLKEMTAELSVTAQIRFCGFVDNILPVLKEADFMILPSRSEGMPNILLEAWSQKLAVISTAVGGVPEMITDGINGILVEPEKPELLGESLLKLLQNPAKLELYGDVGYDMVKRKYSYSVQAELLKEVYS